MRVKDADGNLKSVPVTVEGMEKLTDAARDALASDSSTSDEVEKSEPVATRQLLMAMCATCAHTKASHPDEGACAEVWMVDDGKREVRCRCSEYWATRRDVEDGMPVTAREVSFGGGIDIELNRRITSEFWDGLRQGRELTILLRGSVVGKAFREKDYGLIETRKLKVGQVFFIPERRLAGEPKRAFDAFGREVDAETGEIVEED